LEKPFTTDSYREFLESGKIMASRCMGCGKLHLPPRPICSKCGGRSMEWVEIRGRGTLEAFTVIHVPPKRMKGRHPYATGIVRLEEGPRISGLILDIKRGEDVQIGAAVEAFIVREEDGAKLCFRLV
jgi:uncharacterized OB-fold protein